MKPIWRPHSMWGWLRCSWPLAFHERQIDAFSWATPMSTTFPSPPSAAAAWR
ncbi:MAG: hypothetical protein ACRDZ7_03940 [Acidimicrobiia bacterium]